MKVSIYISLAFGNRKIRLKLISRKSLKKFFFEIKSAFN